MARWGLTFYLLFAVLLGPALCASGLLEHACLCGGEIVVQSCEHEDSCADDPCQSMTLFLGHDSTVELADIAVPQVEAIQPPALAHAPNLPPGFLEEDPPWAPSGWLLPYAKGNRPLII